jgi:hypothetical protein
MCSVPIYFQPCSVHLWYLISVPPAEVWCGGSVRSRVWDHVQPCSVICDMCSQFSVPLAEVHCGGSVRPRSTSSHVQSICDICSVCHLLKSGVAALFGPESGTTSSHVQSYVSCVQFATWWSLVWRLCSVPSPGPRQAMFSHMCHVFSLPPAEVWCGGSVRSRVRDHVQPCSVHLWYCSVCHLLKSGVAALFGPESGTTSSHVQSICDAMEIPHIETRWDYLVKRDDYSINLYPSPKQISRVISRTFILLNKINIIVRFRTISLRLDRISPLFCFIEYGYVLHHNRSFTEPDIL